MSRKTKLQFTENNNERSAFKTVVELVPYLWPKHQPILRVSLVIATLLMIAAKLFGLWVPLLYSKIVDHLSINETHSFKYSILWLILGYGLVRIISSLCSELKDSVFAPLRFRIMRNLTLKCFAHMHQLSLRFHLNRQTGAVTRAIERGSSAIETLLRIGVFSIIPTCIEAILMVGVIAHFYRWPYILVICLGIISYIVFTLCFTSWRIHIRRTMNEINNEANNKALDSLLNYETVKYFGNETHEIKRYDHSLKNYEKASVKTQITLNGLNFGQAFIMSLTLAILMIMAAHDLSIGLLTIGKFVLINTYLAQLYQPLNFLGSIYSNLRQAIVDLENMFSLMAIEPEIIDQPNAITLPCDIQQSGPIDIKFDRVSFSYDSSREILHHLSFVVKPGAQVAIVGPTGAGKSTLSRLLFRFYDAKAGQIFIDHHPIQAYSLSSLRRSIAVVPQDTVLFNDTIGYNIAYGSLKASSKEIEKAAELAQIDHFIQKLPQGYDTIVGERGLKLSGGEKQRIAIARALLKNPRLLILDEATSALDSKTEQEIQTALQNVSQGRTVVTIAHRLSTITHCDLILVIVDGQIIEKGTHQFLLLQSGYYAQLWAIQAKQNEN